MRFIDETTGFLLLDQVLRKTRDGGESWDDVCDLGQMAARGEADVTGIFFLDERRDWAVGHSFSSESGREGRIWVTTDGGKTWKEQNIAARARISADKGHRWDVRDVWFVSSDVGWAAGYGGLFATRDAGRNWQLVEGSDGIFESIGFTGPSTGWAVERLMEESVFTIDGGRNWESLGFPDTNRWGAVFATANGGFVFLDYGGGIYLTNQGRAGWQKPNVLSAEWHAVAKKGVFGRA